MYISISPSHDLLHFVIFNVSVYMNLNNKPIIFGSIKSNVHILLVLLYLVETARPLLVMKWVFVEMYKPMYTDNKLV